MEQNWFVQFNAMIDYNSLHSVGKLFTGKVGCTIESMRFVKVRFIAQPSNIRRDNQRWFNKRTWLARNQRIAERSAMRKNGTLHQYSNWL